MHIGLIGGIGPAATEFYYRRLVKAHAAVNQDLDLTIVNANTRDLLDNMANGANDEQAQVFLKFVKRLQAAGADMAVVTSIAGHYCIKELEEISPLPIVNAIPLLDKFFGNQGVSCIGLLGTRTVLESRLYGGVTSVDIVLPDGADLIATHDNYTAMAISGVATDQQKAFFVEMGSILCKQQGAEAIVLAGTDLFLVFGDRDPGYRVFDCAQIHIDAITSLSLAKQ